jgi:hypothetical protein
MVVFGINMRAASTHPCPNPMQLFGIDGQRRPRRKNRRAIKSSALEDNSDLGVRNLRNRTFKGRVAPKEKLPITSVHEISNRLCR